MSAVATQPDKLELIRQVHSITVKYPRIKGILAELERCRTYTSLQAEPRCMMLTGESGVGKSQLLKWYVNEHPDQPGEEAARRPLILIRVPEAATPKQVAMQMVDEMGGVYRSGCQLAALTRQIARLARELGVEQFIVDEVQHLVTHMTSSRTWVASDWFKTIVNESGRSLVLVGVPEAEALVACNPQLARRVNIRVRLEPFSWVERSQEFRKLLATVGEELPFRRALQLGDSGLAARIYLSTHGNIGAVMTLIRESAVRTIESDGTGLSEETLREEALLRLDQARSNGVDAWNLGERDVQERIHRLESLRIGKSGGRGASKAA